MNTNNTSNQSLTPSIIWMVGLFLISVFLFAGVIPLRNIWLTLAALLMCLWNVAIVLYLVNKWDKYQRKG